MENPCELYNLPGFFSPGTPRDKLMWVWTVSEKWAPVALCRDCCEGSNSFGFEHWTLRGTGAESGSHLLLRVLLGSC